MPALSSEKQKTPVFSIEERGSRSTILKIEWPGTPGPFAWRRTFDGFEISCRTAAFSLPINVPEGHSCTLCLFDLRFPSFHAEIGRVHPEDVCDGRWRDSLSDVFDLSVKKNREWFDEDAFLFFRRPARQGAPSSLCLPWREEFDEARGFSALKIEPPFRTPFPFSARLIPEDGWVLLENPSGESACLDLRLPHGEGFLADPAALERLTVRIDPSCQTPPFETPVELPSPRRFLEWARLNMPPERFAFKSSRPSAFYLFDPVRIEEVLARTRSLPPLPKTSL